MTQEPTVIDGIPETLVEEYLTLVDDSCLAVLPHLLRVAVQFGLAEALDDRAATAKELATTLELDVDHLHRLLRALVSVRMLRETGDGRFELTLLGRRLRADDARSVRESVANSDTPAALLHLGEVIRQGRAGFDAVHGDVFFAHKDREDTANRAFVRRMQERSARCYAELAEAVDWSSSAVVLDIGGANGIVLESILTRAPHVRGILFDRPALEAEIQHTGLLERFDGRVRLETGDFFDALPATADTHVMASVLHDWGDEDALRILRNSRAAVAAGGTLHVVEMLVPEDSGWHPSKWSDIGMMVLTGGRERTLEEYRELLSSAGFGIVDVRGIPRSYFSVISAG